MLFLLLPAVHERDIKLRVIICGVISSGIKEIKYSSSYLLGYIHTVDHAKASERRHISYDIIDVREVPTL